jgi:glycosyltransferase involved in cell wall biosynthesis
MDMLRHHDVLVNLSIQDAYPLTVIEALLCGVAPICCALPGTEEMANEAAGIILVDGQDPQAAADCILTINRDAVYDGARRMQQKFDWPHLRARYRAAFAALAADAVARTSMTRASQQ